MLTLIPLLAISVQSVVGLVLFLLLMGVAAFFLKPYVDSRIMTIVVVVLSLVALVWVLSITGLWNGSFN